ncbi:MAG: peptidylprolyl isomerase [Bacteroidota bacterium]|jgi:peptidyl-prolyl cis-trans isomerase A (cyclophilin A)|nr:peptidylprolyl isomerase [Bacteroidota bacterium]
MNKVRNIIFLLITSAIMALSSCDGNKEVIINTGFGEIHVALDLQNAPVTSANFLRYVDAGLFDSACFYRVVRPDNQQNDSIRIAVIQGGRYNQEETGGFPPIAHETTEMTGIRHLNGTISMARWTPGTATSEFFICVGDQPELDYGAKRNPDGQGFAAFGQVTKGMDVVMKIHSIEAPAQYLDKPILIYSIKRK